MKESLSLGVDLGGTKTEAVVLRRVAAPHPDDAHFDVLARERVPTPSSAGYDAVLAATAELVRQVLAQAGLSARETSIGVGMPGAVTRREGLVKNSNSVCLNGRPFREDLSRALGQTVAFENDANCFALAETELGAGRAHRDGIVFGVIMGTGVGGGLVVHGRVWPGLQSLGGEWGHHAVGPWRRAGAAEAPGEFGLGLPALPVCYCGKTGCLELYAAGPAVERDYANRSGERRSLREIAERHREDAHAAASIDQLLEAFGRGLANVIDIVDPSAIVLGGGVSNLSCLYDEGVDRVRRYVFNDELLTPILKHELGDSAGVLGAALLNGD
ncbi:MAG TPA: ROK family protein [Polyangiaceae bacterium]|nr:ROK family protein [Polyangiaceae bacterium]